MHPPSSTILVSALALLVAGNAVAAQRSSPQFSFPPPQTLASQFGSDVFSPSTQDLSTLSQPTGQQQQQQPSLAQQLGSQSSPLSLTSSSQTDAQLSSQREPQLVAQSQPRQQDNQPSIQLSRPSLSLTSLSVPQQSSRPQPATLPQPAIQTSPGSSASSGASPSSSSSSSSSSSAAANSVASRDPSVHQSSRHHSQPSNSHRSAASHSSASNANTNTNNQHHQNHHHHQQQQQHPRNLQTQQTSQSMNAQNNQAAIESARKAEATAASLAASSGQSYHCPDSFGFFRHHKSCDKYYACENGTAALKLCGNGLMFDDSDPKRENCAYPFSVDCGSDRTDLEPPISTPHCPRLYGLFADTTNCRVFYSCWNGEASKYECPPGLAYDNEQRVCVWADLVERCDQSEVSDGFVCPDPTEVDQPGHYTRHAHPTDCRKFYVCIEGVARPYGCSFGTVFNVDSLQCDEPENVSGCEKYYGDMDPKLAKKLAREGTQGQGSGANQQGSSSSSSSSSTSSRSSSASNQANH